jgi:extracellular factor (EF) 3-hydroxypalmitic acid methyl ester biosynthesis protein
MEEPIFYTYFSEREKQWFVDNSKPMCLIMNQVLIKYGEWHKNFYIIMEGRLSLRKNIESQLQIIEIEAGEVIGDTYFLGIQQAYSDVAALQNSTLYEIPIDVLQLKLANDKEFETTFYKSLAFLINIRLNKGYHLLNTTLINSAVIYEANDIWDKVKHYTDHIKNLLQEANNEMLKHKFISDKTKAIVERKFIVFYKYLNRVINNSDLTQTIKDEIGNRISFELIPYLLLTHNAERGFSKPLGYAGDYLMIQQIYDNQEKGKGALGILLDRCFLNISACKAVRNRRHILANEIIKTIKSNPGKTRIASMACGPAQEVFDCYNLLENKELLRTTLVDIDDNAVEFVENKIKDNQLGNFIKIYKHNLVFLAKGKSILEIPQQDLIYSIGLMDYFSDKAVIAFLDYFYTNLKTGGRVIVGNFHPRNDSKGLMDYLLNWRLIHRTEEQMIQIFSQSLFNHRQVSFVYEEQNINLFAICTK